MIKSNSKKAITAVRKYIMDNTDFSDYGLENPTTFSETASALMHTFYEEKIRFNKRPMSYQEAFIDWLQGLPSVFDSLYYYNRSAVNDLGSILEESEEEKAKYTEDKAERMLSCLIWREIYKACDYCVK